MAELSESRNTARDAIVRPLSRAAERPCARPGCPSPSRATLDFSYATRTARLTSLSDERSPQSYDLCANHADRTTPPHGWTLEDDRTDEVAAADRSPDELDSPKTVAVLAAALRGQPVEQASPVLDDPLREALEELQAVAMPEDAPLAETKVFVPRGVAEAVAAPLPESPTVPEQPKVVDPIDVVDELDLATLTELLTESADAPIVDEAQSQIDLLTMAVAEVRAAEPASDAPGRPVLAARDTDPEGRATLW